MCGYFVFSSVREGLLIVVKSASLLPASSIFSTAFPSTELIATSKMGIDCFDVPFTVMTYHVSWRVGFSPNLFAASLEMKFLPDPVRQPISNLWSHNFQEISEFLFVRQWLVVYLRCEHVFEYNPVCWRALEWSYFQLWKF